MKIGHTGITYVIPSGVEAATRSGAISLAAATTTKDDPFYDGDMTGAN